MKFAQIILPLKLKGSFTYEIPEELQASIQIGMRVLVPFGNKKIYTGIVYVLQNTVDEHLKVKKIINLLDQFPILPPQQMKLWQWMANYYLFNLGELYRYAFPSSLKLESETFIKLKEFAKLDYSQLDHNESVILQALEVRQIISLSEIEAFIPKKYLIKSINYLIDLQYIEIDEQIHEKYKAKEIAYIRVKNFHEISQRIPKLLIELKRASKQKDLLLLLLQKTAEKPEEHHRKSEIFEEGNFIQNHLKALIAKDLVEEYFLETDRIESYTGELEDIENLSEKQKKAEIEIEGFFNENKIVLLHGVTGSGKTHLYLKKMEECIQNGKICLLLVPEIALNKQMTARLEKKYGSKLAFYHQKLSDFEKVEIWKKTINRDIQIVIGTKNALFLPYHNLGLVIVDEEHDSNYRARDNLFYFNAKDTAIQLARFYGAQCILGSATPSLESYWAAQKDKIGLVYLGVRFGNVALPTFEIINYKEAVESKKAIGSFSMAMLEAIENNLKNKKQSIILHNRRGYSHVVECESCGYVIYCSNCDVVLTFHKSAYEMKCHYCGQKAAKPIECPKCQSTRMNSRGIGIEQIHEELTKLLPEAEIDRMDTDTMRKKHAFEILNDRINTSKTDIIVGTQMVSKGLDFDHIELVCIPRADHLLYVQDFRAEERAYQLMVQVSGRAGRKSGKGKVLIQTYNPQHKLFNYLQNFEQKEVYDYLLNERKKYQYPPFVKTILIELKHRKEDKLWRASQYLGSVLRNHLPEPCVLGPEKAPIPRVNLLYQNQILLKLPRGKNYTQYKEKTSLSLIEFEEITAYKSIQIGIFVDI